MPRRIITQDEIDAAEAAHPAMIGPEAEPHGDGVQPRKDQYTDRLVKLIPAEVVALYLFLAGLISIVHDPAVPTNLLLIAVALILWICTPLYLVKILGVSNRLHLLISSIAFVIWIFSLGGPFIYLMGKNYHPIYGALLLPLYTFIVPFIDKSYGGPAGG